MIKWDARHWAAANGYDPFYGVVAIPNDPTQKSTLGEVIAMFPYGSASTKPEAAQRATDYRDYMNAREKKLQEVTIAQAVAEKITGR